MKLAKSKTIAIFLIQADAFLMHYKIMSAASSNPRSLFLGEDTNLQFYFLEMTFFSCFQVVGNIVSARPMDSYRRICESTELERQFDIFSKN